MAPEALVAFFKKDRRCWLFEFMQQFKHYFAEEITIQKKYATEKSVAYLYKKRLAIISIQDFALLAFVLTSNSNHLLEYHPRNFVVLDAIHDDL